MNIFKELYDYRQMIFSLVRKDLRGRYKGSVSGISLDFYKSAVSASCIYNSFFVHTSKPY